jgi:curli biogenesis system outer membrane secretion channel CsgG
MQRKFLLTALAGVLLFAAAPFARAQDSAPAPKMRIAVMNFTESGHGYWSGNVGSATEGWFVDELVNTKKYRVMERAELEKILNEQGFQLSGAVDARTAAKAGKMLGVQLLIFGNIDFAEKESEAHTGGLGSFIGGRLGGVYGGGSEKTTEGNLTARVINVQTGEILFSRTETVSDSSLNISIMGTGGGSAWDNTKLKKVFIPAIHKVVDQLAAQSGEITQGLGDAATAVEGKVVMMREGKVLINIGNVEGVKPDDTYSVVRAEIITDPDSGQELGRDEKPVGRIRVDKVMGAHLSSCTIESGKEFKAGDVVKRK